jgi:retron-type reverse transcriptase
MKKCICTYQDIISTENLFTAWEEFVKGKRSKADVEDFQVNLAHNVLALHRDLVGKTYTHGSYEHFTVTDPKRRDIHKASVRDRLLHHALHQHLYPFFDTVFIHDSYASRKEKGMHKAMEQFTKYARIVSNNHTKTAWVLKCDIKKFFASVDHTILIHLLVKRIQDRDIVALLTNVIDSFHTTQKKGIPLGNLTSQLFANVYLDQFDQHVKPELRVKHYIRYADDFVFLSHNRDHLRALLPKVSHFLTDELKLTLHPKKVSVSTITSGVDFLGWTHFPDHRTLRTSTKRRLLKKLQGEPSEATRQSYLGLLKHGNGRKIKDKINGLALQG